MAQMSGTRAAMRLLLCFSLCATVALAGCARTVGWEFADDPGLPVDIRTSGGEELSGTLLELSSGSLVFDTEIERGENVEVRRRGGADYVYVDGVIVGTVVEIRDFDIVTRRRVPLEEARDVSVRSRGYVGWGTAIAAVAFFFLGQALEEQ
ncbi:MAG: hypothetical protein GF400_01285 [Candidatus Eisenbacteria bacterium]|nr:hypothetical protein [Candidatus Eisenbacteria bacterium]